MKSYKISKTEHKAFQVREEIRRLEDSITAFNAGCIYLPSEDSIMDYPAKSLKQMRPILKKITKLVKATHEYVNKDWVAEAEL